MKKLDDAAHEWVFETNGHKWSNNDDTAGDNFSSFIEGAKWQQKKMFTEEQLAMAMLDFGLYIAENRGKPIDTDNKIKEIIEQFKQQENERI